MLSGAASAVPPIRYDGELRTTVRANFPDNGENSWQLGSINRLGAGTYLWQPWFATIDGNVEFSQINTYAETDSSTLFLGGGGRLNVFPRSRFPFTAFFDVSDSSTDLESSFVEERSTQRLRYGVTQQYRPLSHNATYSARIQRVEETGTGDDFEQASNFADLRATYRRDQHVVDATLNVEQTTQENPGIELLDIVSNVNHSYRPSDALSIRNLATFSSNSTDTGVNDVQFNNGTLSSFVNWRPADRKLSVDGNGRFNYSSSSSDTGSSTTLYSTSGSVTATYQYTRALRFSGTLDGTVLSGDETVTTTGQSVTASYSPPSIPLGDYQYTYFATTAASNRTSSTESGTRAANVSGGHTLARFMPLSASGALTLSLNLSQSGNAFYDSDAGNQVTVNHSASSILGYAADGSRASLQFDVRDSRDVGGSSGRELQSATLLARYDRRFARYSTLTSSANMSLTRQSGGVGGSQSFPSSSIAVAYRHSRFLGVRRLRFTSELDTVADSLTFFTPGDNGLREINFRNKLEYTIGRVEARLEATARESNGSINSFVFFTLTRRLGGIL